MSRQSAPGASASCPLLGNENSTLIEPRIQGSGSGSESRRKPKAAGHGCKYFPADRLLPVALQLRLGAVIRGDNSAAGGPFHQPTQLLHAQDADFAGCWFSPA